MTANIFPALVPTKQTPSETHRRAPHLSSLSKSRCSLQSTSARLFPTMLRNRIWPEAEAAKRYVLSERGPRRTIQSLSRLLLSADAALNPKARVRSYKHTTMAKLVDAKRYGLSASCAQEGAFAEYLKVSILQVRKFEEQQLVSEGDATPPKIIGAQVRRIGLRQRIFRCLWEHSRHSQRLRQHGARTHCGAAPVPPKLWSSRLSAAKSQNCAGSRSISRDPYYLLG
eukprot:scaffold3854_cov251-Pinguiococcus_pyrenoidosus.AAC.6